MLHKGRALFTIAWRHAKSAPRHQISKENPLAFHSRSFGSLDHPPNISPTAGVSRMATCRKLSLDGKAKFRLTVDTINPHVKNMEYAVRGALPQEAARIEADIKKGNGSYPFDKVLHCNIGDCHAMGQKPLTFVRQLLAACTRPQDLTSDLYPEDVKERARLILEHCGGNSIGSYSESRGISVIRQHVAEFMTQRDGVHCHDENIYLLNGASEGIKTMLYIAMDDTDPSRKTGILIPRPQYPLYSAAISQLNLINVCPAPCVGATPSVFSEMPHPQDPVWCHAPRTLCGATPSAPCVAPAPCMMLRPQYTHVFPL